MTKYQFRVTPTDGGRYKVRVLTGLSGHWLTELDVACMGGWCGDVGCGVRVEHSVFEFKSEEEVNWFLLKWS